MKQSVDVTDLVTVQERNVAINQVIAANIELSNKDLIKLVFDELEIELTHAAVKSRKQRLRASFNKEAALAGVDPDTITKAWVRGKNATFEISRQEKPVNFYEEMNDFFSKRSKVTAKKVRKRTEGYLMVIDPADWHFGKIGRTFEVGKEYNLETAYERMMEGVNGLLEKANGYPIERFLLITGNDILHVDNPHRTTTSGTKQDTDGMWYDAYKAAQASLKTVIDTLIEEADVDVMFCPSNHDFMSGFMLIDSISQYYSQNPNVQFDCTMRHRKYFKYGVNLICGSHGDGVKFEEMPLVMAQESGSWDSTKFRYCYLHHIHNFKKVKWRSGQDFVGVTVEYLRTGSNSDRWSDTNFGPGKTAMEAFIHCKDEGQVAKLTHHF